MEFRSSNILSGVISDLKIVLFANTDWYLYNFRLDFARHLRDRCGHEVHLFSPHGAYVEQLEAAGFSWHEIPINRGRLSVFGLYTSLWALWKNLRAVRPDLIHNFTITCIFYSSLVARLHRVPSAVHAITGMGYAFAGPDSSRRWVKRLVSAVLKWNLVLGPPFRLIVQNEDDRNLLVQTGLCKPAFLRTIPGSGVDTERFNSSRFEVLTKQSEATIKAVKVLFVGRLLHDKGIREFVSASKKLIQSEAPAEFLIAGTRDSGNPASVKEAEFQDWVSTSGLQFLGQVKDMPQLLAGVDIVALPSYREGLPRSLLEAAAMSLPLVAADVPGCREIVVHRMNGLLVKPRDETELATVLEELIRDGALRHSFGKAGRRLVERRFSNDIIFASTYEVYKELSECKVVDGIDFCPRSMK